MENFKYQLIGLILFLSFTLNAQQEQSQSVPDSLGIYEKLDQKIPENLEFINENYDTLSLNSLIDKPTVLVMVYYECPGICSPLLEGVADVISKSDLNIGKDYQVFTISFDPSETTRLAKDKKKNYLKLVKGIDASEGWTFFTGDRVNINRLLNGIGYKIKPNGEDWIHPGALVLLSPEGKITRYLHGLYFLPFDFKMAIVEASRGRSGPTINRVLQYCFSYDPEGKTYVFNITKITGTIILFFALLLFLVLILKKRKKKTKVKND